MLEFAKQNSPRGDFLFTKTFWDDQGSTPLLLQPPTNTSNGEIFFIKEVHLLIRNEASLGNGRFVIYHSQSNPSNLVNVDSIIELHNHFDIDQVSLQDPQFPLDTTAQYNKLLLIFPAPILVRSSQTDKFEIKYTDGTGTTILSGINAGEIHISVSGWRILEGSY